MKIQRASGVLLHPTSLPGKYGIGELGEEAYNFVDFLSKSKQKLWQILPLNYPGYGNSPYNPISAFAGNPLLINLEKLISEHYLSAKDLSNFPQFNDQKVEFEKVIEFKSNLLKKAFANFKTSKSQKHTIKFEEFCSENSYWLDDLALFTALRDYYNKVSWNRWDKGIILRKRDAIDRWRNRLAEEISFHKFVQYKFYQQWSELKYYAESKEIKIIGDIPIYVSFDSADVWIHRDLFFLDEVGNPTVVAGAPPDYFTETGQLWGNPTYNWEKMEENDYDWWQKRIKHLFTMVDYARIDHFIGFVRYWAVPYGEKTAINGKWRKGPGEEFFSIMKKKIGELPIIVEDLGVVTPDVIELKNKFGFPGLRLLQFSFRENDTPPHKFEENCVAYTGIHDQDTILGWFKHIKKYEKKIYKNVIDYLNYDGRNICWEMIKLAYSTPSKWAIIPLQDLLCVDSDARMNTPGTAEGNWGWRYKKEMLTSEIAGKLAEITARFNR